MAQSVWRWATGWTIGVLGFDSRGTGNIHYRVRSGSGSSPASYPMGTGIFPWGQNDRGVKLTTYLHLVPRSKNEWSYTSTPPVRLNGVMLS
jgi:hypothetical protein